jgi:hypothetical protein
VVKGWRAEGVRRVVIEAVPSPSCDTTGKSGSAVSGKAVAGKGGKGKGGGKPKEAAEALAERKQREAEVNERCPLTTLTTLRSIKVAVTIVTVTLLN